MTTTERIIISKQVNVGQQTEHKSCVADSVPDTPGATTSAQRTFPSNVFVEHRNPTSTIRDKHEEHKTHEGHFGSPLTPHHSSSLAHTTPSHALLQYAKNPLVVQ
ncbi:hypothetical protein E2C01_049880 [Portunus trituberculatus]|uniref:Uncharacterized protein n=1 Tax=Portunus trituberculatus TaxID=210409 RepID=A0A5B7GAM0_PORTR|nr:hypothetical protein [Portunus trituberculatus]